VQTHTHLYIYIFILHILLGSFTTYIYQNACFYIHVCLHLYIYVCKRYFISMYLYQEDVAELQKFFLAS